MRDINLKTLRLLVAVCDHQNIARAAEQEHIEASAISKRIAQLEADLGAPLLNRTRRGVFPTPAGQAVLEHARSMLFSAERMMTDALNFNTGIHGHVRVLASASAMAEALLDDISSFMREPANRNIKVDVEERFSRDLVRQIREGQASVGVCWDRVDTEGLQFQRYRRDHLALAVHPEHPLADHTALRFDQTLDHHYVSLQPMSAVHSMLAQAAARAGRSLTHRIIVSNFDAAFRVVGANLAISVVPAEVGRTYVASMGIRLIPLTDAWAKRNFIVCYSNAAALPPASRRMVEHLVQRAHDFAAPPEDDPDQPAPPSAA